MQRFHLIRKPLSGLMSARKKSRDKLEVPPRIIFGSPSLETHCMRTYVCEESTGRRESKLSWLGFLNTQLTPFLAIYPEIPENFFYLFKTSF